VSHSIVELHLIIERIVRLSAFCGNSHEPVDLESALCIGGAKKTEMAWFGDVGMASEPTAAAAARWYGQ